MNESQKRFLPVWCDIKGGLPYSQILKYFYPEYITALIIYFLPYCIDCLFICQLKSTSTYAISGIIENFFTQFLKAAEGFSIGIVILAGFHNGRQEYKQAGQEFVNAFWAIIGIGVLVSIGLYSAVHLVCVFNNFSPQMLVEGIPYLKLKSISIFFMFVYFAFVGFLRATKNTFVPMVVFIIGSIVFVAVDYVLIFGKYGFPALCLMGSAIASLIQYIFMSCIMLMYILWAPRHKVYDIAIFRQNFLPQSFVHLLMISMPVVIDKVSIAFAYSWLGSCMTHFGAHASQTGAAFSCIKIMERFAFLPGIACAQIITFLVSNDVGIGNWKGIYANIKKILLLSSCMVGFLLILGSLWPLWFASFLDKNGEFSDLVGFIFPAVSVLILIDLLQLILSAALRGAGDVKTVMLTRVAVIVVFFIPTTYVISWMHFDHIAYKMLAAYAAFLLGNGLMSIVYIYRLRQNHWQKH